MPTRALQRLRTSSSSPGTAAPTSSLSERAPSKYDAISPVGGTFKAGLWNEYEIALTDTGLNYTQAAKADNLVSILSGGVTGTTLDVDAMFFYKK